MQGDHFLFIIWSIIWFIQNVLNIRSMLRRMKTDLDHQFHRKQSSDLLPNLTQNNVRGVLLGSMTLRYDRCCYFFMKTMKMKCGQVTRLRVSVVLEKYISRSSD
eukprot:gb/GECH01010810.1/.p1 GENE.gb/GECH01010810.1/~~gb/GECH01010810.1/.p1  ORF type:complete len:104 (+),score=10.32 gb/GECH01010810.1/:1-312(+)